MAAGSRCAGPPRGEPRAGARGRGLSLAAAEPDLQLRAAAGLACMFWGAPRVLLSAPRVSVQLCRRAAPLTLSGVCPSSRFPGWAPRPSVPESPAVLLSSSSSSSCWKRRLFVPHSLAWLLLHECPGRLGRDSEGCALRGGVLGREGGEL